MTRTFWFRLFLVGLCVLAATAALAQEPRSFSNLARAHEDACASPLEAGRDQAGTPLGVPLSKYLRPDGTLALPRRGSKGASTLRAFGSPADRGKSRGLRRPQGP